MKAVTWHGVEDVRVDDVPDPKIINGSRRLRIANGSGVTVSDVNDLVNRFFEARKQMKMMAGQFGFGGDRLD